MGTWSTRASGGLVMLVALATIARMTLSAGGQSTSESPFIVKPYLQLGDLPKLSPSEDHAPFNSSRAHFNEQQMRLVSDVLEHRGVDIVFNGHVHNYQRTRPLKFLATPAPDRSF